MLRLSPLNQYYCQHLDHMFQRWSWDWAHSMSLRKVSSLYAGANTLLCRHWVAKTCSLSISTALALVVGVSTGLNLSLFINTSSWKAKSGSLPSPPADFALDNATNRAPWFLASKPWSPEGEPLHTWMLLQRPQSSPGICGFLFPMPVIGHSHRLVAFQNNDIWRNKRPSRTY